MKKINHTIPAQKYEIWVNKNGIWNNVQRDQAFLKNAKEVVEEELIHFLGINTRIEIRTISTGKCLKSYNK